MTDEQKRLMADPEARRTFEEELLFGEATDTVSGLLTSAGLTQKELASRLQLSEGRISQILSGGENLTLRTLASIGWALGARFELQPVPIANRAGTPAQGDRPFPSWATNLALQRRSIVVKRVELRSRSTYTATHRALRVVNDGTPAAA